MVQRSDDSAGVVIPLRSFNDAKARLSSVLTEHARAALARTMAERVVEAAATRPIVVVTSAPEVVEWCAERSIATIDDPGTLDAAADTGRGWVQARELARVIVVHADLPYATTLDAVAGTGNVAVIVPDHRDDGTPVLALPVDAPFNFSYGPGSAARHIAEAERCGLDVRVVRDEALAFDVDIEADLRTLESRRR